MRLPLIGSGASGVECQDLKLSRALDSSKAGLPDAVVLTAQNLGWGGEKHLGAWLQEYSEKYMLVVPVLCIIKELQNMAGSWLRALDCLYVCQ